MRKLRNDNKVNVCTPFSPRYDMRWSKKNYANFYDAKIALKSFQNSRVFYGSLIFSTKMRTIQIGYS